MYIIIGICVLAYIIAVVKSPIESPRKYPFPAYVEPPPDAPISSAERIARRERAEYREKFYDEFGYDYIARQEKSLQDMTEAKRKLDEYGYYEYPVSIENVDELADKISKKL